LQPQAHPSTRRTVPLGLQGVPSVPVQRAAPCARVDTALSPYALLRYQTLTTRRTGMHVDGNEYATTAPAAVPVLAMVARVDELYRTLLAAKDAELVSKEAVLAGKDAEIVAKDQLAAELRRRAEQAEAGRDALREHLT